MSKSEDRFDAPLLFSLPPEVREDEVIRKQIADANARAEKLEAERDAYREEAETLRARVDAFQVDEAEIDRIATHRLEVIDKARTVLGRGYFPASGTSSRDTMLTALSKIDSSQRFDAKSNEYIAARFDAEMERAAVATQSFVAVARATVNPSLVKGKLDTALDAAAAEAKTLGQGGAPAGSKRLN